MSDRGETKIKVQFFRASDATNQRGRSVLYISGTPQPGEQIEAIGLIEFPAQPGQYEMTSVYLQMAF